MPQSPLTGQFIEKPTYWVRCLYVVDSSMPTRLLQLRLCSNSWWRPTGVLLVRMALPIDVVDVALEDDLQEGEDEGEEHPDLHHLHVAGLRQRVRYADQPAAW
jgi:hypothetical protein